jgi:hypothetical protein
MDLHLLNIINTSTAPIHIALIYNDTRTDLYQDSSSGGVCWVGNPVGPDGTRYRFALRISPGGRVEGTGALDFIASKGAYIKGARKPAFDQRTEARAELLRLFIAAALLQGRSAEDVPSMIAEMEAETGFSVMVGETTEADELVYSLTDSPARYLRLAKSHGLRFVIDIPKYIARFVSPSYAKCVKGNWDLASDDAVDTSNLYQNKVALMKMGGYRFNLVSRRAVR